MISNLHSAVSKSGGGGWATPPASKGNNLQKKAACDLMKWRGEKQGGAGHNAEMNMILIQWI